MGIATPHNHHPLQLQFHHRGPSSDPMSHHGFHHGFLGFPSGDDDDDGGHGGAQTSMNPPGASLAGEAHDPSAVYDPSSPPGIFSEMLNFHNRSASELLAAPIPGGWYGQTPPSDPTAMQLFMMNLPPATPTRAFSGAGQGLSLSLSPALQQLEAPPHKPEELYYSAHFPAESSHPINQGQAVQVAAAAVLRQSKYTTAAQELLEEFCSVGRDQLKRSRRLPNPNPNLPAAVAASTSSSKDPTAAPPPLSAAERFDQQRKKSKLSSMLDEVERRYNHYCDQMQMVVNSFDAVMGYGAAAPYTGLARKAMSRHFRCLKDAIVGQLRNACEALGEKDGSAVAGISKGETPRLRELDKRLRQQRSFNQMGMMEQEAWRPQRGLPERSVNILRAWLFEHFLHPYPNDADKHMLARQTGLSRNQVTNWFINARVRLWKPMVEEMYQQEAREEEDGEEEDVENHVPLSSTVEDEHYVTGKRLRVLHETTSSEQQQQQQQQQRLQLLSTERMLQQPAPPGGFVPVVELPTEFMGLEGDIMANYGATRIVGPATQVRYGPTGDVSLTLGLRHTGNAHDTGPFTLGDFAGGGGGL